MELLTAIPVASDTALEEGTIQIVLREGDSWIYRSRESAGMPPSAGIWFEVGSSGATSDSISDAWNKLETPIFKVLDEDGVNMENGMVRRLDTNTVIYVDDVNGWELHKAEDFEDAELELDASSVSVACPKCGTTDTTATDLIASDASQPMICLDCDCEFDWEVPYL